mmetsp:Transcript_103694/g.184231  ORF Transcript_103694/g.184231 Transcript_103694/m.184231 type:complete len:175 (-) Transcript_103694:98-622(-)
MSSYESMEVKGSLLPAVGNTIFMTCLMGLPAWSMNPVGLQLASLKDMKLFLISFVVYMLTLFVFLFRQGMGKNLLNVDKAGSEDPAWKKHVKNLDRTAMNALEQAVIFIPSSILYTVLVEPKLGGILTLSYVAFLMLYSPCFDKGLPVLFISTMPRYLIVFYMLVSIVLGALAM